MKSKDIFLFAAIAAVGYAVWQYLKGRQTVPANQFGQRLTQAPGPQLGYQAPQLNETGARPVVSRANQVLGAVQSGAAVAINLSELFRNLFGSTNDGSSSWADYQDALRRNNEDVMRQEASIIFGDNTEPDRSGEFDPNRGFDEDVFALPA